EAPSVQAISAIPPALLCTRRSMLTATSPEFISTCAATTAATPYGKAMKGVTQDRSPRIKKSAGTMLGIKSAYSLQRCIRTQLCAAPNSKNPKIIEQSELHSACCTEFQNTGVHSLTEGQSHSEIQASQMINGETRKRPSARRNMARQKKSALKDL